MGNSFSQSSSISIGGYTVTSNGSLTDVGVATLATRETLPAGKAGVLTTRTDNNTGVITSNAHGFTDASTVSVTWTGGQRRCMTVSTYDTNTITIDGGDGDNLPAEESPLVFAADVKLNMAFDGDDAFALVVHSTQNCCVSFRTAVAEVFSPPVDANYAYVWIYGMATNPFLGEDDNATVKVANGSTTAATFTVGVVYST